MKESWQYVSRISYWRNCVTGKQLLHACYNFYNFTGCFLHVNFSMISVGQVAECLLHFAPTFCSFSAKNSICAYYIVLAKITLLVVIRKAVVCSPVGYIRVLSTLLKQYNDCSLYNQFCIKQLSQIPENIVFMVLICFETPSIPRHLSQEAKHTCISVGAHYLMFRNIFCPVSHANVW